MSLERIFQAKSVAIVGASRDEKKRGYQAIKTLLRDKYEGRIYAVNPREESVLGFPCYSSVLDIKDELDLVLITTPAKSIPGILEQCGKKGVAGAVVIAGGFGELGGEGKLLEHDLVEAARKHRVRVIGPNTSGMINVNSGLNLVGIQNVPRGDIALLTQSGNIALHLITEAQLKSQRGFSYYVGVGNEAEIKFHEYLEYFTQDQATKAILMYVEGLREGRNFLQQAYKTTLHKPIILLKSGRSSTGRKSAGSHTGALAGISEVARTAFKRAGITTIEHADELFPVAETLSSLPYIKNNKIAILADGGGHATIAADLLTDHEVEIPKLSKKTQARLAEILPPNASLQNPVDVAGGTDANPAIFADCAKILLEDDNIGGLLIVGLFGGYGIRFAEKLTFNEEDAAHRMGKLLYKTGKPIVLHSLYNFAQTHPLELLRYYGIPVFDSLDIACKCIGALSQYGSYLDEYHSKANFVLNWGHKAKKSCQALIANAYQEGRTTLLEHEAKELLRRHGAPVGMDRLARSADEAVQIAREMGRDVVLKIVSPQILHKSDACAVKLKLETEQEIRAAYKEIIANAEKYNPKAELKGCLVSPMVDEGVELIVGTKIDEQFGPVIMFGLGGILVEIMHDVVFRVLPITSISAKKMLKEIKSRPILDGARGRPGVDKKALQELLLTVSDIIQAYPEIREMDLNPVIAHEKGASIVDARIILHDRRHIPN